MRQFVNLGLRVERRADPRPTVHSVAKVHASVLDQPYAVSLNQLLGARRARRDVFRGQLERWHFKLLAAVEADLKIFRGRNRV